MAIYKRFLIFVIVMISLILLVSAFRYDLDWETYQAFEPSARWDVTNNGGTTTWVTSPAFGNYSIYHTGNFFTWFFDYGLYGYDDIYYLDIKTRPQTTPYGSYVVGAFRNVGCAGGQTAYIDWNTYPINTWINFTYAINSNTGFVERTINGDYSNFSMNPNTGCMWMGGGGIGSNPMNVYYDDLYIYNLKPITDIQWSGAPANNSLYQNVNDIDFGYQILPFYYNRLNETDCDLYVNGSIVDSSYSNPVGTYQLTYPVGANEKSSLEYEIVCAGIDNEGLVGEDSTGLKTINICNENWVLNMTNCAVNDTMIADYYDSNECGTTFNVPIDSGSVVPCNYCLVDYSENIGACDGITREVTYSFNNYGSCCALTNITDDCTLPTNFTEACQQIGIHSTSDITGLVIDTGVELGRNYIAYVGLFVLLALFFVFKYLKKNNYF